MPHWLDDRVRNISSFGEGIYWPEGAREWEGGERVVVTGFWIGFRYNPRREKLADRIARTLMQGFVLILDTRISASEQPTGCDYAPY